MRRKESFPEQLHRYRGVLTVISVPVLLIIFIIAVMPHGSPTDFLTPESTEEIKTTGEVVTTAQENNPLPAGKSKDVYAVVFDAGSTGSRVHVVHFEQVKDTLELQSDSLQQLKPGLSSYADDPETAANSLKPLLEFALKHVPKDAQAQTKVKLGATAGLRLLPDGKADAILSAVRSYLAKSPFELDPDTGVTILDGSDEGAFAWLTLNYLLGFLGKDGAETMAAIDLGGGSVQEAFALTDAQAKAAPDPLYVTPLKGGGRTYSVYVHSYLGYGLMAGRAAVLAWEEARKANPCVPTDHTGTFEYGGQTYDLIPSLEGASRAACERLVTLVLKQNEPCGAEQTQCSFAGAWGGGHAPKAFYVSSYFWDRAVEAEIIKDHNALTYTLKPKDLEEAADMACQLKASDMSTVFPDVDKKQAPFMCLDLSFCHSLITHGFKIAADSKITLVKRIQYKDEEIEAAWPLGAAINMLNN
ncbi:hypothetical protein ABBQ32_003506 [Trebouxia sp. C0010 RCD-2024]